MDNFRLEDISPLHPELKMRAREYYEPQNGKREKKKRGIWESMFKKNKLNRPNMVAIVYLRNNGIAETFEVPTKNGFFTIDGKVYHERRDCTYTIGKERFPFAIIPEWSVIPLGRKEWYDKNMQEKFSTLQDHVIKGIRHAERVRMGEGQGVNPNVKKWIGIAIAVMVVGAIAFQYLGK